MCTFHVPKIKNLIMSNFKTFRAMELLYCKDFGKVIYNSVSMYGRGTEM